jgi:hypothetical protein
MPNLTPGWLEWIQILGGGSIGGFVASLILEPIKRKIQSPSVQFDFPISEDTDLQDSSTTAYLPLSIIPNSVIDLKQIKEEVSIRFLLQNKSRFFNAEGCRVFLTSIKTRDNPEQVWKTTEYKENNQVAWAEKPFEFEAVDIFPQTSRAVEILILARDSYEVAVRIPETHFSFSYLFPSKPLKGKGWKFSFLAVGKNISPTPFEFVLEAALKDSMGVGVVPLLKINGCPLSFDKLHFRNILDPVAWEALRGGGELPSVGI